MKKKLLVLAMFGLAGLAAFAGTCTVTHVSLVSTDGTHDTFGGQLDNTSGVNILDHNFVVAFLDSSGNVVETKSVSGCLRSIQNNTSDYFSAVSTRPSSATSVGLARIAFDSTFKVGTVSSQDVTVTVKARRAAAELTVRGTVKNNASDKLFSPNVCIVVRDAAGNVLITGKVSLSDLAKDAVKDFVKTITVPDDDTADTVDVYVDGLDSDDNPTAPEAKTDTSVELCDDTPTATKTATSTNTVVATNTPAPTNTPTSTPTGTLTPAASTATNTPTKTNTPAATSTDVPC